MTTIADNLQQVRSRIATACAGAGRRSHLVTLLAVSKTFSLAEVEQAWRAGQRAFGENYVQEGVDKVQGLRRLHPDAAVQWHCIGPLQSNKTRLVAEHFDWVHSIDRIKVAQRLSEQRPPGLPDLQVCIQVNVDGGQNKAGVAPEALAELAGAVARLPRLRLRGLMSIPEPSSDKVQQLALFRRVAGLQAGLNAGGLALDTLSMGMSDDLDAAIEAGSTLVRVGRAIFGQRSYP